MQWVLIVFLLTCHLQNRWHWYCISMIFQPGWLTKIVEHARQGYGYIFVFIQVTLVAIELYIRKFKTRSVPQAIFVIFFQLLKLCLHLVCSLPKPNIKMPTTDRRTFITKHLTFHARRFLKQLSLIFNEPSKQKALLSPGFQPGCKIIFCKLFSTAFSTFLLIS